MKTKPYTENRVHLLRNYTSLELAKFAIHDINADPLHRELGERLLAALQEKEQD